MSLFGCLYPLKRWMYRTGRPGRLARATIAAQFPVFRVVAADVAPVDLP